MATRPSARALTHGAPRDPPVSFRAPTGERTVTRPAASGPTPSARTVAHLVHSRRHRRTGSAEIAISGTTKTAVGLSSTAVFVVPLIAISALPVLLWRREWTRCATVLALGVGPLAAGLVTVLSPVGARNETGGSRGAPWVSALADGRVAIVAVLAALVVILGVVAPAWWGTVSPSLQGALVGVLGVGLLA